jgi:hypothetical protein
MRSPGISHQYVVAIVPLLKELALELLFSHFSQNLEFFKGAFGVEIL